MARSRARSRKCRADRQDASRTTPRHRSRAPWPLPPAIPNPRRAASPDPRPHLQIAHVRGLGLGADAELSVLLGRLADAIHATVATLRDYGFHCGNTSSAPEYPRAPVKGETT